MIFNKEEFLYQLNEILHKMKGIIYIYKLQVCKVGAFKQNIEGLEVICKNSLYRLLIFLDKK